MFRKLVYLLKNNLIASLLSYVLTITIANSFGAVLFGNYSLILVAANLLVMLIIFGTENTASKYFFVCNENVDSVVNDILGFRCLLLFLSLFVVLILSLYNDIYIILLLCLIPAINLSFVFEVKGQVVKYSYIFLLERVVYSIICLTLIYFFDEIKVFEIFFVYLCVTLASFFIQAYILDVSFRSLNFTKFNFVNQLNANSFILLSSIAVFSYGGFSRLLLESSHEMREVGIYSAAWQFVVLGTILQSAVDRIWRKPLTNVVLKSDYNDVVLAIKKYFFQTTSIFLFMSVCFYLVKDLIVSTLFSEEYEMVSNLLMPICFYFLVININGLVQILAVALKKTKVVLIINLIFSLILISLLLLFSHSISLLFFCITVVSVHFGCVALLFFHIYMDLKKLSWSKYEKVSNYTK